MDEVLFSSNVAMTTVKKVKAWARICLEGCSFIETTPTKLKVRKGEVCVPCTITYQLPAKKKITK